MNDRAHGLEAYLDRVHHADAVEFLRRLPDECIDAVVTDPPYFLDKLDDSWSPEKPPLSPTSANRCSTFHQVCASTLPKANGSMPGTCP